MNKEIDIVESSESFNRIKTKLKACKPRISDLNIFNKYTTPVLEAPKKKFEFNDEMVEQLYNNFKNIQTLKDSGKTKATHTIDQCNAILNDFGFELKKYWKGEFKNIVKTTVNYCKFINKTVENSKGKIDNESKTDMIMYAMEEFEEVVARFIYKIEGWFRTNYTEIYKSDPILVEYLNKFYTNFKKECLDLAKQISYYNRVN